MPGMQYVEAAIREADGQPLSAPCGAERGGVFDAENAIKRFEKNRLVQGRLELMRGHDSGDPARGRLDTLRAVA